MPSRRHIHRFAYGLLAGVLASMGATTHAAVEISEFMADNNGTLEFADGTTPDWIEIHNPDATPVDLAGWHLTDDALEPDKWTFPAGATIAAGDYLVVYASGLGTIGAGGEYHTDFSLDDQGEYLALVRPDDTVVQEFYPTYPKQYSDVSYGLPPGVAGYGYFTDPTPGEANNSSVQDFVKDTTFTHKRGFYDALSSCRSSNLAEGAAYNDYATAWLPDESTWKDHTLPSSTFAAGINTIAVEVHQDSGTSSDMRFDMILIGEVSGGGSNISNPLYFSAPTLLRARSYASSTGEWSALNEASFLLGIPASSDNLVISKIHYHPSDAQGDLAEYVELLNISDQPVNLAGGPVRL